MYLLLFLYYHQLIAIRMVVFDYPTEGWHHIPVERRFAELVRNINSGHPFIVSSYLII